jgi:hypothetical protein
MFDANLFKRAVKDWIQANPSGTMEDLREFCEEQIPTAQYAAWQWLIEQTTSWYGHVLRQRDSTRSFNADDEADAV